MLLQQEMDALSEKFFHSADFTVKEITWKDESKAIICYYSSLVKINEIERYLNWMTLEQAKAKKSQANGNENTTDYDEHSLVVITESYEEQNIINYVCNGEAVIISPSHENIIRISSPNFALRSTEEPTNEQVLRGAHEGLVEDFDANVSLIRKRFKNQQLVVKKVQLGKETKVDAYYFYIDNLVDQDVLHTVEQRLQNINIQLFYSLGQLMDKLDDQALSPFPQLLSTERPDRVIANLMEGKVAVMTDNTPTAIIGPITLFSFYQSPDDFNARPIIGTFYLFIRIISIIMAIYLPALYISIVSFHADILPVELANQVKKDINLIPYRPFFEALIMQFTLELIREGSIRLPKSIGQTVGIVGGLVIGDAIVSAGLVSNLMVIVVAFTAIASFVVPSIELNTTIRVIGFPMMIFASFFGFYGIMICTFFIIIHLMNLTSFNKPYLHPLIPFEPNKLKKVFIRIPHYRASKQASSFTNAKGAKS